MSDGVPLLLVGATGLVGMALIAATASALLGAKHQRATDRHIAAVMAEALFAIPIGRARCRSERSDDGFCLIDRGCRIDDVAHPQHESIAAQVAGLELVVVAFGAQHTQPIDVDGERCFRGYRRRQADPLPRYGVAILHAGGSEVAFGDSQCAGQQLQRHWGREPTLFNPHEDVITRARWQVCRKLLDFEILGSGAQYAADAGVISG